MQNQDPNNQITNNPELDELLNPRKTKTLLVVSLVGLGLLLIMGIVAAVIMVYTFKNFDGFDNFDDYYNDYDSYDYEEDSGYNGDGLIEITPDQARSWFGENQPGMNALAEAAIKQEKLKSVWVATSYDQEANDIFVWINDKPCTADPGRVSDEPGDERYLFSDVLKEIEVSVVDFYEITSLMKEGSMEGYELYYNDEDVMVGIDFFHESYDGTFYYSSNGEDPDVTAYDLAEKWWFIEP